MRSIGEVTDPVNIVRLWRLERIRSIRGLQVLDLALHFTLLFHVLLYCSLIHLASLCSLPRACRALQPSLHMVALLFTQEAVWTVKIHRVLSTLDEVESG